MHPNCFYLVGRIQKSKLLLCFLLDSSMDDLVPSTIFLTGALTGHLFSTIHSGKVGDVTNIHSYLSICFWWKNILNTTDPSTMPLALRCSSWALCRSTSPCTCTLTFLYKQIPACFIKDREATGSWTLQCCMHWDNFNSRSNVNVQSIIGCMC